MGPLRGLPFAVKDTHAVAGWRTTYGSPLFGDCVPDQDDLIVERVRRPASYVIGKTNVPEFAAGSHTFNRVFGTTLNPVDPTRSAGGSSGGAAAALVDGVIPLADGSDMGGSLRNPASFCGAVGLRPSPRPGPRSGRTPTCGRPPRSVGRWLATWAISRYCCRCSPAPDPRSPTHSVTPDFVRRPGPATSPDSGSHSRPTSAAPSRSTPRSPGSSRRRPPLFGNVADAHPDLPEADDTFRTLRAWHFQTMFGDLLATHPAAFKQSLADNIRAGEHLTGADVARAYRGRTTLSDRMCEFFDDVRRARPPGRSGAAVPGRPGVPGHDQRPRARRRTSTGCGPAY